MAFLKVREYEIHMEIFNSLLDLAITSFILTFTLDGASTTVMPTLSMAIGKLNDYISQSDISTLALNIARGTTDPEIDSVTWINFCNNMTPFA